MNKKDMNSTEWHDGRDNAVEINDPNTLVEDANGKWRRVNGWTPTETTINGKNITTKAQYFNGYQMNMSTTANVTKAESAAIWISVLAAIIVGIVVSLLKNPIIGIFMGIFLCMGTMVVVGSKAMLRADPEKNSKIVIWFCSIFIAVLIIMSVILIILF